MTKSHKKEAAAQHVPSYHLLCSHSNNRQYELLRIPAETNKSLTHEICETILRSFCDVEYNIAAFEAKRRRLIEAVGALG